MSQLCSDPGDHVYSLLSLTRMSTKSTTDYGLGKVDVLFDAIAGCGPESSLCIASPLVVILKLDKPDWDQSIKHDLARSPGSASTAPKGYRTAAFVRTVWEGYCRTKSLPDSKSASRGLADCPAEWADRKGLCGRTHSCIFRSIYCSIRRSIPSRGPVPVWEF
jgi:hypothetical protein